MAIKGCKSVAEFYIRTWMKEQNLSFEYFTLEVKGNIGIISDKEGGIMKVEYDAKEKKVNAKEW